MDFLAFWQVESRVMEAINILWLHVDTCLFFHMWVGQGEYLTVCHWRQRERLSEGAWTPPPTPL